MVTQIIVHELGVRPDEVRVCRADSLGGVFGSTPTGSRMALLLTVAILDALTKLRGTLSTIAASELGVAPENVEQHGAAYRVIGEEHTVPLARLAHIANVAHGQLPTGVQPGLTEQGVAEVRASGLGIDERHRMKGGYPTASFSAHLPVVEVDRETFQVEVVDYIVVHDCGTAINPTVVDGMINGGIAHGIGAALHEKYRFDDRGRPLSSTLMDYLLPRMKDVPPIALHTVETPSPHHPYGAKGTAEGGYMTAPAAIVSAVEDALSELDVDLNDIPVMPADVAEIVEKENDL
jgi:2-furoyl-CoA dehydrogenase large subunit